MNKVCVGWIKGPKGIKGELKITLDDCYLKYFLSNYRNINLTLEDGKNYSIERFNSQSVNLTIKLKNINDRNESEKLKGKIYCSKDELPGLDEDEYYYADIIGAEVFDEKGENIGVVESINNFGAGDILEIHHLSGEKKMYPFQKSIFSDVFEKKIIAKLPKDY